MSVRQRLVAFALALLVSFAAGYGLGGAVDPVLDEQPTEHGGHGP